MAKVCGTKWFFFCRRMSLLAKCLFRTSFVGVNIFETPLCQPTTFLQFLTANFKKIRGGRRPLPPGMKRPEPSKYGWRPVLPADGKYTTRLLPIIKLGGRDPETGRVVVRTIGGGHKKKYRWVDTIRQGPKEGPPLEEKVFTVRYDPCRTAHIALVASGIHKRWIIASANMKPGDVIQTSGNIPRIAVRPQEGDAHPLGALPVGTMVHNIEPFPGMGGIYCRAAGASSQLIRKAGKQCILQLPSKQEVALSENCMAVVGQVSNIEHGKKPIGSAQRNRWLGKRPRSGLWHRKDGYCGRKIRPPPPLKVLLEPKKPTPALYQLTM